VGENDKSFEDWGAWRRMKMTKVYAIINPALSLATGFINPTHQFNVCQMKSKEVMILVNRRSFLNERYLSASLYRPNDGYMRRSECTRRGLCDCRDAREISEEELGVGRWDGGYCWIWSGFWEDTGHVKELDEYWACQRKRTLSMWGNEIDTSGKGHAECQIW